MAFASYYKADLHPAEQSAPAAGMFSSLMMKYRLWRMRSVTRRQLRALPDYVLNDIGITRYQIENDKIRF